VTNFVDLVAGVGFLVKLYYKNVEFHRLSKRCWLCIKTFKRRATNFVHLATGIGFLGRL